MRKLVSIRQELDRLTAPGYVATQLELDDVAADWLLIRHGVSESYHAIIQDRLELVKIRIALLGDDLPSYEALFSEADAIGGRY